MVAPWIILKVTALADGVGKEGIRDCELLEGGAAAC